MNLRISSSKSVIRTELESSNPNPNLRISMSVLRASKSGILWTNLTGTLDWAGNHTIHVVRSVFCAEIAETLNDTEDRESPLYLGSF